MSLFFCHPYGLQLLSQFLVSVFQTANESRPPFLGLLRCRLRICVGEVYPDIVPLEVGHDVPVELHPGSPVIGFPVCLVCRVDLRHPFFSPCLVGVILFHFNNQWGDKNFLDVWHTNDPLIFLR